MGSADFVALIFRICLRSLQLVMALVVVGLYGTDLNEARRNNRPGDIQWVRRSREMYARCTRTHADP